MKRVRPIILLAIAALLFGFSSQAEMQDLRGIHSRSGQFIVHPSPFGSSSGAKFQPIASGEGLLFWSLGQPQTQPKPRLHLEPALVAVSCERIKDVLLRELGETDSPSRRVHVQLNSRIRQEQSSITPAKYQRGWVYTLELPVEVDSDYFTGAILNVLLLDLANRTADGEPVDVPNWFVTGLIAHLQGTSLASFSLENNFQLDQKYGLQTHYDPLGDAREKFKNAAPLSFDELSWPEKLSTNRVALFKDSAQLFVSQLLRLKDGKQQMCQFIAALSFYKNWQFAFLAAYQPQFSRLVDVEKWWALEQVGFSGRDPSRLWSKEESWKKLKATLDISVNVRLQNDRLPVEAELSLQDVIMQWDTTRQEAYLRKAANELAGLRFRIASEYIGLVDDYRRVIENYLQERKKSTGNFIRGQSTPNPQVVKKTACRQLDQLDERRSKLRPLLASSSPTLSTP